MDKHTARAEGSQFIRHFVNGEQVACVPTSEWDEYVATAWALTPEVVALRPELVPNFPGDKSSGTPSTLASKEDHHGEIAQASATAEVERAIQEAEEVSGKPS